MQDPNHKTAVGALHSPFKKGGHPQSDLDLAFKVRREALIKDMETLRKMVTDHMALNILREQTGGFMLEMWAGAEGWYIQGADSVKGPFDDPAEAILKSQ